MRYTHVVAVVIVVLLLVDHIQGLKCPKCNRKKCPKPKGCSKSTYVRDNCNCCNVCPTKFGKICSGLTPKCEKNYWCISKRRVCAMARKKLIYGDPFQGVCGKITAPKA